MPDKPTEKEPEKTALNTTYILKDTSEGIVSVSLSIGEGAQKGESKITVKGKTSTIDGEVINFKLGRGDKLDGETIRIESTVSDIVPGHNHVTLTVRMKGGAKNILYPPLGKIVDEGGTALFSVEFFLFTFKSFE